MLRRFFMAGACLHLFSGFGTTVERVDKSFAFKTGPRWDTINSSGALSGAAITNNGIILLDTVSGNPITRKLNNINAWQVGAEASLIIERCFFIGTDLAHGFIFSNPREILSGLIATSDAAFSQSFDHSITRTNEKQTTSSATIRLGPQIRLKGPVYIIPYFGFTYERLALSESNSIRTQLPNFGASVRFWINRRFEVSAFCHYNFRGRRKEKIRMQVHDSIDFYLPAELIRGRFSGPCARLNIDWRFAQRWRLGLAYNYRSYRSANAENAGFGGTCGFKTTWQAESVDARIRYVF